LRVTLAKYRVMTKKEKEEDDRKRKQRVSKIIEGEEEE
jgi:hypothetical protein